MTNDAVSNIYEETFADSNTPKWYGEIESQDVGLWIDYAFLLLFGGIPWQCYYQRVLSSKTPLRAQMLSYGGACIALIMTGELLKLRQNKLKLESRHVLIVNITNLDVC